MILNSHLHISRTIRSNNSIGLPMCFFFRCMCQTYSSRKVAQKDVMGMHFNRSVWILE
jgi:hypothetical protein